MMFYEESQIEEYLKCPQCKNKFDEPRMLPCGKSVCNKCIQDISNLKKCDISFKCVLCGELHFKSTFPVNQIAMGILMKQPSEVSRGRMFNELKENLKEIRSNKIELENTFKNSWDHLKEHCLKIRGDIDLATEIATQDIQEQREELLKKVEEYEKETILAIQKDKDANEQFEKTIKELDQFGETWSSYLNKVVIDETKVTKSNEIAIELKKETQLKMEQLKSFIFNYNKVFFENNSDKFVIGDIKFQKMNNMLRKIDSLILSNKQESSLLSLISFESKRFDLLWRGSRDGYSAKTFHSLCDNKGETLTVVKSKTGYIFGGYTSVRWESCDRSKRDNKAFLFSLTNPSNVPLKMANKGDRNSICDDSNCGPTFGESDLHVSSDSNLNADSFCFSGSSYQAPNSQYGPYGGEFIHGGGMDLNRIYNFKTFEIEVYLVS